MRNATNPRNSKRRNPKSAATNAATELIRTDSIENMIRERAYYLWEGEGKPHGRETEHWQRAQADIERQMRPS